MYLEETDEVANAPTSFPQVRLCFLSCFEQICTKPSMITSLDASLEARDIIMDKDDMRLSSVLIVAILVTPRNFPLRSIPSSISSFKLKILYLEVTTRFQDLIYVCRQKGENRQHPLAVYLGSSFLQTLFALL